MIGLDSSSFMLMDKWVERFSLSVVLKTRRDNFVQVITSVYDPNRRNLRPLFWQEILSQAEMGFPWVVGGDFNIIHFSFKRKGCVGDDYDRQDFNSLIDQTELMNFSIADRLFTWSNLQDRPILARLDKVLIFNDWETRFALAILTTLP